MTSGKKYRSKAGFSGSLILRKTGHQPDTIPQLSLLKEHAQFWDHLK